MIAVVPPSTGRVAPPTETAPPTPIPTTIHPTCALAVCPLLTVSVFEALLNSVDVLVEFLAVVVAGRGDGFRVLVDVGLEPRELGDCGSWLVVPFVGLTDVFRLDVLASRWRVDCAVAPVRYVTRRYFPTSFRYC